jgi:adenylate kinase family enzyme
MIDHVHIFGASGSGTSALGAALASRDGYMHLDTDDFFWTATHPPFQRPREIPDRQALLTLALRTHSRWVLSGSLCGWGDLFIQSFDLAVFLYVPTEIRMSRLKKRERDRYGAEAISPGGELYESHAAFLDWAARYDVGRENMRSLRRHEQWIKSLKCPSVRLDGATPLRELTDELSRLIRQCRWPDRILPLLLP